ncbi:hypothetical protein [Phaeobacter piscinae]|uniref:hypothetical protein n=1 Tax=Phaeobacter piscinae TaxID=1580596 RepID=UPI0005916C76|nr:hypothetical protein [Phaeobacter piscinae]UTS81197.1 hypothetical protein OL67_002275 [Phaeobacter piscinae]
MRLPCVILLTALCGAVSEGRPAWAGAPLTADQFDRYTQGRTLFYGFDGVPYGVERYLPNRRVIWSFLDGQCQDGEWYPEADQICFIYDDIGTPQCWQFSIGDDGLIAQFDGDPEATELYEAEDLGEDMLCLGPKIGV